MKVLYFGIYDSSYSRNWVLINGLKKNGVEVIELNRKPGKLNLIKLFFDYFKLKKDFDVMIVGFPGQEVMFLARAITEKPIIFDAFTSHYGGYILDRKKYTRNSFWAKYYRFLDNWSCRMADLVLLDTQSHINFFVREYGLSSSKFKRLWVGVAEEDKIKNIVLRPSDNFKVTFFGTYIPLQGAEFIIRAAKLLEVHKNIKFNLIGRGQQRKDIEDLSNKLGLKNVEFRGMMSLEKLREELVNSDVCLGIFGNSPKTPLVIPNKVYEGVALERPVITADTEAVRELFDEEDMILIPPADEKALADAILRLRNDLTLQDKFAVNGHRKFIEKASYEIIGRELKDIITQLLHV